MHTQLKEMELDRLQLNGWQPKKKLQPNKLQLKPLLARIDRICAWSMLGSLLIYFVTGYGMSKGYIAPELSKLIHQSVLPIPSMIAFAFHSAFGVQVALKRWKKWSPAWSIALVVYVSAMVVAAVVFQFIPKAAGAEITVPARIEL